MSSGSAATQTEELAILDAVRADDAEAFAAVTDLYRRPLQVHCYRMLGSFDDAEDLVQETMLRAWRSRLNFEGRSQLRTWLYRIATNVCLNSLKRTPRRLLPQDVGPPVTVDTDTSDAPSEPTLRPELPWLQPYPDRLLMSAAPSETEPDAMAISRETIELAFLAALQHLPPRQRAVLVLHDVLGWSAKETAALLEVTVAAVNSALQRSRSTMRTHLPSGRQDWASRGPRTEEERGVLKTFMDAWEQADAGLLTALMRDDARWAMPPAPLWFDGVAAIARLFELFPIGWRGDFQMVPTGANGQPAAAAYLRLTGESEYRLVSIMVLRIECGKIAEVTAFTPTLCRAFNLPRAL